ncbi:putative rerric reductase like transmembrane component [Daldinia bambusicola]|nr:putative rerric reductase like transmembrane component [Daldinia bambusicola]
MRTNIIIHIIASLATAESLKGVGLIGYGISMYDPICAYACHDALSLYQLGCSTRMGHEKLGSPPSRGFMTSDTCYATDDNYLRSVAYCIGLRCSSTALSDLEHYWANFLIGNKPGQTLPKEPYSLTLAHIDPPPDIVASPEGILNQTTLVSEQGYSRAYARILSFQHAEITQSKFGEEEKGEILRYVANRMAVLSLSNFALLVLYAGRNNILLLVTGWSHSTFLLLHRWIAIICTLEACVHASIYLKAYLCFGEFATESKKAYWICGNVAVLSMSILLPASCLPLRQKFYNLFLTSHFAFAFAALVGCYFHIYHQFMNQQGYESWIYIAFAFWAFDRLMRFVRLLSNGVCKAEITILDEDYIRVEIPNATAQGHAYLYFPTIRWLVWENHPFSILGTIMVDRAQTVSSVATPSENGNLPSNDLEKSPAHASATTSISPNSLTLQQNVGLSFKPGLTFFVRTTGKGLTAALRKKTRLPVLLETSYAATSLDEFCVVPNRILIAGGVGISAVVPALRVRTGRVRLFWGVRSKPLVEAVNSSLGPDILTPSVVGEIAIGRRLNLPVILEREVVKDGETAVVVCGPNSMADEVRAIVSELGRKGRIVRLVDEAFSW